MKCKLSASDLCGWKPACAVLLFWAVTVIALPAQKFTTLVNFNGTNGAAPQPEFLAQGTDGNFYGTTLKGGANDIGTVFMMTPSGKLTVLHSFDSDGANPAGALVQAADRSFYGTTQSGGAYGYGTVFKITKDGTLTTLHSFNHQDGSFPNSTLVLARDGNYYGTTGFGGNLTPCPGNGCGTIFKITPSGALTTLYEFCSQTGCSDGATPFLSLAQGTDGNFYGATFGGGDGNGGTIFKITPQGALTTLAGFCPYYPFCDSNPLQVVRGTDGNYYGMTAQGGQLEGTIFKITPDGIRTTLYQFCTQTGCADGSTPRGVLTLGHDGNFYGTTYHGGTSNQGTVFKITPAGVLTTLHSFHGWDGRYPIGGVFQAKDGTLYGTTTSGGSGGQGTIYRLSPFGSGE